MTTDTFLAVGIVTASLGFLLGPFIIGSWRVVADYCADNLSYPAKFGYSMLAGLLGGILALHVLARYGLL